MTEGSALSSTGVVKMDGSASSIEFTSIGSTKLYFNGTCDGSNGADNAIYFTAYVDGARQAKRLKFYSGVGSALIASGLDPNKTHTIKIVRESEKKYGGFTAHSVSLQTYAALGDTKPGDKGLKLEFIGDSITCGLGSICGYLAEDGVTVLDTQGDKCPPPQHETSYCEDATNTYAYLAAQALNADCSFVSRSGLGVTSTWGLPTAAEYYESNSQEGFTPDLVIINLGTNDKFNFDKIAKADFINGVKALIAKVRDKRGDNVKILWTTGLMGDACKDYAAEALEGYSNVYHFTGLPENRGGHNGHPTKEGAAIAAEKLVNFIIENGILSDK